ncbi:MAG TPA: trypsin-like peptidase domain-containing protein [Terriglobales bacterium]|nr:trypsin-like peptidase domain-containing protein [Terriglobales bacterium]
MSLQKLLEDARTVIADLDEACERLHAAPAPENAVGDRVRLHTTPGADVSTASASHVQLGCLDSPAAGVTDASRIRFAALSGSSHRNLLEDFANAGSTRRSNLAEEHRKQLFSIIFALYRPGPAFSNGHTLAANALSSKVTPGGNTWQETVSHPDPARPASTWDEALKTIAAIARQCPRLDQQNGTQAGSGFLLAGGTLLTARHVILYPGWLFGNPPDPSGRPGWVRYNRVSGAGPAVEALIPATDHITAQIVAPDMAAVNQTPDWRAALAASVLSAEFGSLPGLLLQTEPLSEAELKSRPVAVIGHPLRGNAGGDSADVHVVFGDAPLGTKRFMPGQLDGEKPLLEETGQAFLNHDCSTLGGASGSCLLDLATARVLGIHVAGGAFAGNRAVPSWIIAERLAKAGCA